MTIYTWHAVSGSRKRRGYSTAVADGFTLGVTRPVPGVNVGVDPNVTLTAYSGPNAGGTLTVTSPSTYENIDFGTTVVVVNSSDVFFKNCKWRNTKTNVVASDVPAMIDFRGGSSYTNRRLLRCTIENASQFSPGFSAYQGYNYVAERCVGKGFSDISGSYVPASRPDTSIGVELLGCWHGELGWWWAPNGGAVHPSDTKTHNDVHQHQGGRGLRIIGCDLPAYYSTTIGTGTPNSGNNTAGIGASVAPYTQSEGEAKRQEIVFGSGSFPNGNGGSLAGILFSAQRGSVPACEIRDNWGAGGAFWLNDGTSTNDDELTYSFGYVTGNRIVNDQRNAGWAFGIHTGTTAYVADNYWTDGSGLIPRRNA